MTQGSSQRFGRLQYWQGQTVRAQDFRDRLREEEELLRQHNRIVHGSFGVSFGLSVRFTEQHVHVACGLAYDCAGQALVLQREHAMALPAKNAGIQLLVLRRREPEGSARAPVEAATSLHWIAAARFRSQCGVPIARALWDDKDQHYVDGALALDSLSALRMPRVRPVSRLPMAAGFLEGGQISWEALPEIAGLQVRVDTAAAGFVTDRVMYLASLLWGAPNERFAAPFVSVVRPSARGFTLRLLLPRSGAMSFPVVYGAGLVGSELNVESKTLSFAQKVQFRPDEDFVAGDKVARLAPSADRAWPLQKIDGDKLSLANPGGGVPFESGDLVVAANFPRRVAVLEAKTLLPVTFSKKLPKSVQARTILLRMGATGMGSAARVVVRRGEVLWLESDLTPELLPKDKLGVLGTPAKIAAVDPIVFESETSLKKGFGVLRTQKATGGDSNPVSESASKVSQVTNDGTGVVLDPALSDLSKGDTLSFADFGTTSLSVATKDVAQTIAFRVASPQRLAVGDLVRMAGSTTMAFVMEIQDDLITLDRALDANGTTLEVADFAERTTVVEVFKLDGYPDVIVQTGRSAVLKPGDIVLSTKDGSSATSEVRFTLDIYATFSPEFEVARGDTLRVVRFAHQATVTQLLGSTLDRFVVDLPGTFAIGDTLALVGQPGDVDLARVAAVDGATVSLRAPLRGLAVSSEIAVVSLRSASAITVVSDNVLTVAPGENFRSGDLVARFTHWDDATDASTLEPNSDGSYALDAWLDGLLPYDAVGFAALSEKQPRVRFSADSDLSVGQRLRLMGPHASTRSPLSREAFVVTTDDDQVQLSISAGTPSFMVRPEELQVIDSLADQVAPRFAAYAAERKLRIAWFGAQLPAPLNEQAYADRKAVVEACPLHVSASCTCCESSNDRAEPTASASRCCK